MNDKEEGSNGKKVRQEEVVIPIEFDERTEDSRRRDRSRRRKQVKTYKELVPIEEMGASDAEKNQQNNPYQSTKNGDHVVHDDSTPLLVESSRTKGIVQRPVTP